MEKVIKAVRCVVCGMLHEQFESSYVTASEGFETDGTPIVVHYCNECFGKKRPLANEHVTKRNLLCD